MCEWFGFDREWTTSIVRRGCKEAANSMTIPGSARQIVRWGPVLFALFVLGAPAQAAKEPPADKPLLVKAQAHLDKN
jgi:hypothetical protein